MFVTIVMAIVLVIGGLVAYSASRASRIGDMHPPSGKFTRVDGIRMHFVRSGPRSAQAVLLLHGASGNLNDMMLALGEPLSKDLNLIAMDRPGHGWSDPIDSPQGETVAEQARYIVGALDNLKIGSVIVVGHSWGGALALTLALDYPDRIAGLVLLAPASHPWSGGIAWYNTIASLPIFGHLFTETLVVPIGEMVMAPSVRTAFTPQDLPEDYIDKAGSALVLRPAAFRANARDLAQLHGIVSAQAARYPQIKIPTVIITGDEDRKVLPSLNARRLAEVIDGAQLIELKGVGHMPHFAAPDVVVVEIERMADELSHPAVKDSIAASTAISN